MSAGTVLLAAAVLAAAATLVATGSALRGGQGPGTSARAAVRAGQIGRVTAWVGGVLVAAAALHFAVLLVAGDFSVAYVWRHSASHEPALRRISAILAGQEGSFLVWSLAAAGAGAWTARRWGRSTPDQRRDAAVVHLVAAAIALGVLLLTVAAAPFRSFAAAFPTVEVAVPVEGRGLNPVLANPWMPPHTVLTFAAYALIGLAFAVAILELLRAAQGRPVSAGRWRPESVRITRWAFLLLTAALFTGLMWAYEEMTFGWFWSWDPVEAATLSVWLLVAAALHARGETGSDRHQIVVAPLLTGLAFIGVVFASFVTRSGLHPSVHAFASGATGRWLGVLLAVSLVALAALTAIAARSVPRTPPRRPWLFWAAWLLVAGAALISWGLAYPMAAVGVLGRSIELDTGFFTLWGYVVALALLLMMGFGLQVAQRRRRDAAITLAVFVALTAAAAFITPVDGLELRSLDPAAGGLERLLGRASLLTLLPPVAYALLAIGERWWATSRRTTGRARLAVTGSALAHVGVVAGLAGLVLATLLSSTATVHVDPVTGSGRTDGVAVQITHLDRTEHTGATGDVIELRETASVEVFTAAGLVAQGEATLSAYPEREMGRHARVLVSRGAFTDIQVIYQGLAAQSAAGVPVTVRRIPLVGVGWAGFLLLMVGSALITAAGRAGRPARGRATARTTASTTGGS